MKWVYIGLILLVSGLVYGADVQDTLQKLSSDDPGVIMGALKDMEKDATLKSGVIEELNKNLAANALLQKLIPKGKIKIDIVATDGTRQTGYIVIDQNSLLSDIGPGETDDWKYSVEVYSTMISQLRESPDPISALVDSINTGQIKFNARTFGGRFKLSIMRFIARIVGIFI